ncbi:ABC transporter ATP-binding protein [Marinimicrobium agarilyticum]|uniref:ABC transporter ATP-binding protein n=1 Tax=Marinimicrobium agarilyticum TaxID=306546 RepID=UPI00055A65C1|nr:ABC transporter ATP-binding protein [Marinimicrobium agarilyticum]
MTTDHLQDPSTPAIVLKDVRFSWAQDQSPLFTIPDWGLNRGERLFLYGPSGSGKTSLLNLLAGIILPQNGRVELLGQSMNALSGRARDRFRARHIGVVFQQFNLIPYLSVLDNVGLAAHFARDTDRVRERSLELLRRLDLPEAHDHRPASHLSVGQQQRVAVARALISRPEIVLADEPTSALDSDSRAAFMALLLEQVEAVGSTLVFVSHDRSLASDFDIHRDLRELSRPFDSAESR